jgi:hypothetical protein
MSISGFIHTEYFVNDFQKPLVSGQAFYQNDYFNSFDEVDYSFIKNDTTGSLYLYVVNNLYESVILIPRDIVNNMTDLREGETVEFTTTVDWLFGDVWHYSSVLAVSLTAKLIGNHSYLVFSSESVKCEEDADCLFQLYDLFFDGNDADKIAEQLKNQ